MLELTAMFINDYGIAGVLVLTIFALAYISRSFLKHLLAQTEQWHIERQQWQDVISNHIRHDIEMHERVIAELDKLGKIIEIMERRLNT